MQGIGEALARAVYKEANVAPNGFYCKAWVVVSEYKDNLQGLLNKILEEIIIESESGGSSPKKPSMRSCRTKGQENLAWEERGRGTGQGGLTGEKGLVKPEEVPVSGVAKSTPAQSPPVRTVALICAASSLSARFPSSTIHEGRVVCENTHTLSGLDRYLRGWAGMILEKT
jgi:hypothetical protein